MFENRQNALQKIDCYESMKVISGGARADRYKWSVILDPYKRPKINGFHGLIALIALVKGQKYMGTVHNGGEN